MKRHYGMDWLRIGAFALLILYHVGMVFVPWPFHVKTAHPLVWAEIPMFITSPWRLALLFLVSGYASRALLFRSATPSAFLRGRSGRLLLPLAFGMVVVVPPQAWVELTSQHGYRHSFPAFYLGDYFRFGAIDGVVVPTWNHLWFVAYLWAYTAVLTVGAVLIRVGALQGIFDRIFAGWCALVLPAFYVLVLDAFIFPTVEDTHDLLGDGVAHLRYLGAFLFGFGLAGSPAVLEALAVRWRTSAVLACSCFLVIASLLVTWPDFSFPDDPLVLWSYRVARRLETWTAIAALIGIADRFLNRDHPWRAILAEATFPFYLIHQTIIVVAGGWIVSAGMSPAAEFAILVGITASGCWLFYAFGARAGWLRRWIGLRSLKPRVDRLAGGPGMRNGAA